MSEQKDIKYDQLLSELYADPVMNFEIMKALEALGIK
jgi:hypothetical protein